MTDATRCDIVPTMQSLDRYAAFVEAVLDLSDEPTPTNLRRYSAASRLLNLDESILAAPRAMTDTGDPPVREDQ